MPNKQGVRNLITLIPLAFLFVDKGEDLILVLLLKANLEHKKICASNWLKPPIFTQLTHIVFGFYVLHSRFGFALQEAYLQFKCRQHRGALNNDIGNFMASHFDPIGSATVWSKNETCLIITPGVSPFYLKLWGKNGTSLKAIFLLSKSH